MRSFTVKSTLAQSVMLPAAANQLSMKTISSRQNPTVHTYRALAAESDPDGVRLLLDGAHLVREAHAAALRFESVAVAASHLTSGSEEGALAEALDRAGVDVAAVNERVFKAISPVRTPSGIIAITRRRPTTVTAILAQPRLFALVIVDVQDSGNLGALLRVAEAGGVTGVIVCGGSASPFSWKAVRGSMGSVLRLPIAREVSVDAVMTAIRQNRVRAVASVPRDGSDPDAVDWAGRVALLLGGEGQGLSPHVVAECDQRVSIPMAAPVESLNVATSAAILIYAARRARR